ncbi:serine protease [Phaeobacter inhibens]|uniref:S1 family peptidase n=1 Tax=Phaeobacter inhibens TaxID=221822 RepID=UPI0021A92BC5|nr:serine protease [Phaeobacter inhibens]UWR91707.1 serine protease [Phaeobacter inhibens]
MRPLLTLLALTLAPGMAVAQSQLALISEVRNATVYLHVTFRDPDKLQNVCVDDQEGTGFIVSPSGGILTAAHILTHGTCEAAGFTQVQVEGRIGFKSSPPVPVSVASILPGIDVAVLRLGARATAYPALTPCFVDMPQAGTELMAFGFALGQDLTTLPVIFQGLYAGDGRWRVSSQLTYGMSGGPVTDKQGNVLAMVKSGVPGANAVQTVTPVSWTTPALMTAGAFGTDVCPDPPNATTADTVATPPSYETPTPSPTPIYEVEVVIEARAPERRFVSRTFPYDFGSTDSCDEGWTTAEQRACLPTDAEITRLEGPRILSAANDGRTWNSADPDPACVVLHYGYSDRGLDLEGNCRGEGWIAAEWTLQGIADGAINRRQDTLTDRVRAPEETEQSLFFNPRPGLLDGLNASRATWSHRVWVRDAAGATIATLGESATTSGKFSTTQDDGNGTVTLTIEP